MEKKKRVLDGWPFPSPGDLPEPGFEPTAPASLAPQVVSLPTEPPAKPMSPILKHKCHLRVEMESS